MNTPIFTLEFSYNEEKDEIRAEINDGANSIEERVLLMTFLEKVYHKVYEELPDEAKNGNHGDVKDIYKIIMQQRQANETT